jgi:hypothetical protein
MAIPDGSAADRFWIQTIGEKYAKHMDVEARLKKTKNEKRTNSEFCNNLR